MKIANIEGATRVCGETQGYRGLPIRDEVIDDPVNGPGTPQMVTAWELYPDELERLQAGAQITLSILGSVPPPLLMDVGPAPISIPRSAFADIAAERRRQIETEGWSHEHDDKHTDQSLAMAAALYASPRDDLKVVRIGSNSVCFDDPWPWVYTPGPSSYVGPRNDAWDKRKKHDRRRRLVIAAALIIAEIERLDRKVGEAR